MQDVSGLWLVGELVLWLTAGSKSFARVAMQEQLCKTVISDAAELCRHDSTDKHGLEIERSHLAKYQRKLDLLIVNRGTCARDQTNVPRFQVRFFILPDQSLGSQVYAL